MNYGTSSLFRASSVTQFPEPIRRRGVPAVKRPHDTVPGRTARQWFAHLLPALQASTPTELRPHPHFKNGRGNPLMVAVVTGRPTFRNVIDENGAHV